jgi:hypothetical protein
MIKLGRLVHAHAVSGINKIAPLAKLTVPEVKAYKAFVKVAAPLVLDWNELFLKFKDKLADPEVLSELNAEMEREIDLKKLPSSILDKFDTISPDEFTALEFLCEEEVVKK